MPRHGKQDPRERLTELREKVARRVTLDAALSGNDVGATVNPRDGGFAMQPLRPTAQNSGLSGVSDSIAARANNITNILRARIQARTQASRQPPVASSRVQPGTTQALQQSAPAAPPRAQPPTTAPPQAAAPQRISRAARPRRIVKRPQAVVSRQPQAVASAQPRPVRPRKLVRNRSTRPAWLPLAKR